MLKVVSLLCIILMCVGCAGTVKQSGIVLNKSVITQISDSVSINLKRSKKQDESYVFDESLFDEFENCYLGAISNGLTENNIIVQPRGKGERYRLLIEYTVDEEVYKRLYNFKGGFAYLNSLLKVKTDVVVMNSKGDRLYNISLDNLSNIERKGSTGVTVESMPQLGARLGKLASLILVNVKSRPVSIRGKWVNANNNASLNIQYNSKLDKLVGVEDELYVHGNTVVKMGDNQWLHIDIKNKGSDVISSYSGEAKHINKVTDDFSWKSANFDIIGDILFVKHSNFANEETAVYVKN